MVLSILALCLPALALADGSPHGRTIVGTLTANPSGSVTVTSSTATLTCSVPDRAIGSVAKLKLGGHFKIACRADGTHLVLVSLKRVESPGDHGKPGSDGGDTSKHGDGPTTGTTDPPTTPPPPTTGAGAKDARGTITALGDGSITVTRDGGTFLKCSITDGQLNSLQHVFHVGSAIVILCNGDGALVSASPITDTSTGGGDHGGTTTTTTTPPPPPPPPTHTVLGVVTFLSSTGVTVTPDGDGSPLTCAITPAADSTAAAAKLKLGGRFGIVCRADGTHYVLSGSTPLS